MSVTTLTIDPEFHALIPPLTEDERSELEASLLAEGCRDALVTWNGVIVDGHNRYELCTTHGIEFQTVEREFSDRSEAMLWIIRNQFARRNLTPYVRTQLALRMKAVIAKRGKENMSAGGKGLVNLPNPVDTRAELAQSAHVSGKTVSMVETVERDAPEPIKEKARAGDISTHRAYQLTRELQNLPAEHRDKAAALCVDHDEKARILVRLHKSSGNPESNGTYDEILSTGGFHYGDDLERWCDFQNASLSEIDAGLKSLAKHHRQLAREAKLVNAPPLPDGVYSLIYADPPWRYEHVKTENRAIENHYPTMELEEICALPISGMSADDAILFLWSTNPKLAEAMQVIEAWGFTYRTNMVWVKDKIGMGYYMRGRHELLLIATKGTPGTPLTSDRPDSVIEAAREGHSKKPEQVYLMLERMYPNAKRIELFARGERNGWARWGNEITPTSS